MAENGNWVTMPTTENKKKAAANKAATKAVELAAIKADVDPQLETAIASVNYIKTHDFSTYIEEFILIVDKLKEEAAATKKATNVGDATSHYQTIVNANKRMSEIIARLKPRVDAKAATAATAAAERERALAENRERDKRFISGLMMRKEWNLERLYKLLYEIINYYMTPLTYGKEDMRQYIRTQAMTLRRNISSLEEAPNQKEINQYVNNLRKELNKEYKSLFAEKNKTMPDPTGRPVALSQSLNEAKNSVSDLLRTIEERRLAREKAEAEYAAESAARAAAAEKAAAERAAAEAREAARRERFEAEYQARMKADAEAYRQERERARAAAPPPPPPRDPNQNAYKTLGVAPGANSKTITAKYRKLALKFHPDKGGDAEKFKEIQSAYNRLMKNASGGGKHTRKTRRKRRD